MIDLNVSVPGGSYPVMIEAGLFPQIGERLKDIHGGRHGLVVFDDKVRPLHGQSLMEGFSSEWNMQAVDLEASEASKRLETVGGLLDDCLVAGLDRGGLIAAVGGGITGDVAGFVAASYMRGISLVQIPTTLLAMVDASVGGKTGVNLPLPDGGGIGKNLAGAFWQPEAVLMDPLVLKTLDQRELRCGLGECIKHAMIADPSMLDLIESDRVGILAAEPDCLERLIHQAVQIKISVIENDERESGVRASLNLGHTFAHAIEPIGSLDLRHGEAVAIGLVAAATCALELGMIEVDRVDRMRSIIELVGLPSRLSSPIPAAQLIQTMRFDKKAHDGQLRLVLPDSNGVSIHDDVPMDVVQRAWEVVGAV
ncbi:MAG: 3-dehydroquinate synthase [Phycisphaerales bacterium]|nr:3-dehydroquinate synthase [Phycisphaerales bacterium]|tara:strand:+ start:72565 stop:73665 length:1101 start_codon:yes stop_codon:yes gene_type:complete